MNANINIFQLLVIEIFNLFFIYKYMVILDLLGNEILRNSLSNNCSFIVIITVTLW